MRAGYVQCGSPNGGVVGGVWLKWLLGSSLPEVIDYIFPRTFMALDVVDKYYDFKWSWVKSI